jgi:hypothetical protein
LSRCTSLTTLPAEVGGLRELQELSLEGCLSLGSLPESLGGLKALQKLSLAGCLSLRSLSESWRERVVRTYEHALSKPEISDVGALGDAIVATGNLVTMHYVDGRFGMTEELYRSVLQRLTGDLKLVNAAEVDSEELPSAEHRKVLWKEGYLYVRCATCARHSNMALCKSCFRAGDHNGHSWWIGFGGAGGFCDCGDDSMIGPRGSCPRHRSYH